MKLICPLCQAPLADLEGGVGCPAGQGLLDIPSLLAALRAMNRSPSVILEHWPPPEPTIEASIAKEEAWTSESIRYLRELLESNADPPPRNSQ